MNRNLVAVCILIILGSTARADTPPPILALKGLDPIALAGGKELPGLDRIEAVFGRYKYRFANEPNKAAFLANPEMHAIQFAGACGKMGPFSGAGSPERYFVHDRRIYIFASEFCRNAFKTDPEKHIERPNPLPKGSAAETKAGSKLIEKALEGFGGANVVDAVKTLRRVEKIVYKQGNKETIGVGRTFWLFPNAVREEEDYGTAFGHVLKGTSGFEIYGKHDWPLEPAMRDVAWRRALREPLVMLRNRTSKGFVAVARGVNTVEISLDGATSTWTLDEVSGRILKMAYVARRGTVGDNVTAFSEFKTVNGLVLPHRRTESFNGKELTMPERRLELLEVNGNVSTELFLRPK